MPPILITEQGCGEDIHHKAIKWHYAVELQGNVHMEAAIGTAIRAIASGNQSNCFVNGGTATECG